MLIRRERDLIAAALRSVIDEEASEHFYAATQEHQLTSRIAALVQSQLNGLGVFGRRVFITTQEFPDKGRGSLEKPTGIDLYVGITDTSDDGFAKGFFVQAKWKEVHRSAGELSALKEQCERMLAISESSYVWLYGPDGVDVVRAQEVTGQPGTRPEQLLSRKTDDLFKRVMECPEGDRSFGIERVMSRMDRRAAISTMMEELRIRTAIGVTIS